MELRDRQIALVNILKKNPNNRVAKKELVDSMYRFVWSIAKKITRDKELMSDLVQEGFISIFKNAINKYDSSRGISFLSYSVFWVIQAMKSYLLDNFTQIRFPKNVASAYYRNKCGSKEDFSKQKWYVKEALKYSFISTDTKIYNDKDELRLIDVLKSDEVNYLDSLIYKDELDNLLQEANLTEKEFRIVTETTGFYEGERKSLVEKSLEYGLSKERIRQIRNSALKKLKNKHRKEI